MQITLVGSKEGAKRQIEGQKEGQVATIYPIHKIGDRTLLN
jgi:hypothetical protein